MRRPRCFPSDEETRHFLEIEGRGDDWREITADAGCSYDYEDEIDLSKLEPLIATPSSPGNVVRIGEVEGKKIYQSLYRIIGQSGLARFCRRGRNRSRKDDPIRGVVRRQSDLAADPGNVDR